MKDKSVLFKKYGQLFAQYMKLWKSLPDGCEEKEMFTAMWQDHVCEFHVKHQLALDLVSYNSVINPLYKTCTQSPL